MSSFAESYLGQLRALVGRRELILPGARIVIPNQDDDILFELKGESMRWGFPGGCAEVGESIEQVARREVLEETGLSVETFIPFGFASDPDHERGAYPNGDAYHAYVLMFIAADYSGEIRTQEGENIALRFFPLGQLPDPIAPNVPRTIAAYQRFRETGAFQLV